MRIKSFNVSWEADHEQYYQGHGISFTDYTHTGSGCSSESLSQAFDEAIEDLIFQDVFDSSDESFDVLVADMLAELQAQVKEPEMLDWDIVKAECAMQGTHRYTEIGSNEAKEEPCICAVCQGEWHFYVNVDVEVEEGN